MRAEPVLHKLYEDGVERLRAPAPGADQEPLIQEYKSDDREAPTSLIRPAQNAKCLLKINR